MLGTTLHMGINPGPEESACELTQIQLGPKMVFATAGAGNLLRGADLTQPTQTLKCAPAAGLKAAGDLIEIERIGGGKKQPVNLPNRRGQGKGSGRPTEHRNTLQLEGIQLRLRPGRLTQEILWLRRTHRAKLPPPVKTLGLRPRPLRGWFAGCLQKELQTGQNRRQIAP
jgi:hypothetical protein